MIHVSPWLVAMVLVPTIFVVAIFAMLTVTIVRSRELSDVTKARLKILPWLIACAAVLALIYWVGQQGTPARQVKCEMTGGTWLGAGTDSARCVHP